MVQQLVQSIKIHFYLSKMNVPHIQQLYTVFEEPSHVYLLMEPLISTYSFSEQLDENKRLND